MDHHAGDLFAQKYRLVSRIGEGGYGVVWRAQHEAMGRDVAIKMLRPEAAARPEEVERFRREAYNASCLRHAHTITLYDYGQSRRAGELYIVMEYLVGMNLGQRLSQSGPLGHRLALTIMEQTLLSLREAHHQGILHRDIKPENIFLSRLEDAFSPQAMPPPPLKPQRPDASERLEQEEAVHVKVLDFGLSKALGGSRRGVQRTLTKEGQSYGTPQYMSPEQACAMKLTPASDIYALGLVCWEALTGHCAFSGSTPVDVLLKQVNDATPPLPRALHESVLESFIERATRKDPERRFPSAREALEWLLWASQEERTRPTLQALQQGATTTINHAVAPPDHAEQEPALTGSKPWHAHRASEEALTLKELDHRLEQLPMIGRREELQEMLRWGQQAMITGGTLWLRGVAGSGAARLLGEWRRHMEMYASVFILQGRYAPGSAPLSAMHQALSPLRASSPIHTTLFASALSEPTISRNISLITSEFAGLKDDPSPTISRSAEQHLVALMERFEQTLYLLAQRRPTILMLEDLHHADALSLKLVRRWSEQMATRAIPLVLVFTERAERLDHGDRAPAQPSRFAHIHRRFEGPSTSTTYAYELRLEPLAEGDAEALLDELLPFEPSLKARVLSTARGNPTHLRQMARHLFASGLIERSESGDWALRLRDDAAAVGPGGALLLPPELQGEIVARLDAQIETHRLAPIVRALLERALCLGDAFETRLLKAMLRAEHRPDLELYLDEALEYFTRSMVFEARALHGRPGFGFSYEMVRQRLLDLAQRRDPEAHAALQALAARTKQSYYGEREGDAFHARGEEIAAHWAASGAPHEAITWWMHAARHSEARQDFRAALRQLSAIAERLDEQLDPDGELRLEVQLAEARMMRFLGEFDTAAEALTRAAEETRAVGDLVGEAYVSEALATLRTLKTEYHAASIHFRRARELYEGFDDQAGALRCDLGLAALMRFHGRYPSAAQAFEACLERSIALKSWPLQARALFGQGQCAYAAGALRDATDLFRRARKLAETHHDALLVSECDVELTTLSISTRHIEHAVSTVQLALETKRHIGDSLGQAHAHLVMGMCLRRTHRLEEALQHAARAERLYERLGHDYGLAKARLLNAELHWTQGDYDRALEENDEALLIHRDIGDLHGAALSRLHRALCLLDLDDAEGAHVALNEVDELIEAHGMELYRASSLLHRGAASELQGDLEASAALMQRAVDHAAARGNIETAALATIRLTAALIVSGDLELAATQAALGLTRAEFVGHHALLMFALTVSALIAKQRRDEARYTSLVRRLRMLREHTTLIALNLPVRLTRLAHRIGERHDPESAFAMQLAIVELLRAIEAEQAATHLAQRIMRRP